MDQLLVLVRECDMFHHVSACTSRRSWLDQGPLPLRSVSMKPSVAGEGSSVEP